MQSGRWSNIYILAYIFRLSRLVSVAFGIVIPPLRTPKLEQVTGENERETENPDSGVHVYFPFQAGDHRPDPSPLGAPPVLRIMREACQAGDPCE